MAEILLYGSIYSFTAEDIVSKLNDMDSEPEITLRISSGGGDVFAGYSILAKLQEYKGKLNVKVDGWAASMAAFMLLFASDSESLDVTNFTFHRADAYISTPEDQAWLDSVNKMLRSKMEQKIDAGLFQSVTGYSYDEMFDPAKRIDVNINATQAKQLGLIKRITTLSVSAAKQIQSDFIRIAAHSTKLPDSIQSVIDTKVKPINTIMTIAELKAAHPAIIAEIEKNAADAAVNAERDRVGAFMEFHDIDPVAVKAGIEAGKPISATEMAAFARKGIQAASVQAASDATQVDTTTDEITPEKKAEAAKLDAFLAEANADRQTIK
jgi:ATP-dependent protease ClpP protease subunit